MSATVHGRDHSGDLHVECDVAVVGTGAGGAVVAKHLSEAGQQVALFEEGGHIRAEEFARMRPSETMRHAWRETGLTATFPIGDSPLINVMMGRCVGGSSAMTGGVCFRIPENVLAEWRKDHGLVELTPETIEPYYADVERTAHVAEVPVEMRSRSTQLFGEGARKLGFELSSMRRNTHGCVGWSTCNFGCPQGAKMNVQMSYLPSATQHGARVYSDCLIERVVVERGRAVGVQGRVLNGPNGGPGGRLFVRARRVVLAASAYFTPLILMRSGIGRRSKQVGRNLTLHPAFRVMARFEERVDGWRGALQSAFSTHYEPEGIQLNSVFTPAGILAATMPGIGPMHQKRVHDVPHLAVFGANLHDAAGGVVRRGFGREPFVTYRMSGLDRQRARRALQICADTFFAAGAKEVFLPLLGSDGVDADQYRALDLSQVKAGRLECTSQHPLGTCRMGTSAEHSVVDPNGRTWDVDELYIADGSIVPTSLGVNPQLAIMTLATRIAWHLRQRPFAT